MKSKERDTWLFTVTANDRPGVIAEIAGRLGDLGCSIVVASTEVVVGQVVIMVMASAPVGMLGIETIGAVAHGLRFVQPDAAHPVRIPSRVPRWPQPGSELHRLRFSLRERAGAFYEIAEPVASKDVPFYTFSTWVDDQGWCNGDVMMAIPPEVSAEVLGNELYKTITSLGPYRSISWRRIEGLPVPPRRRCVVPTSGVAISVIGFARPGFVRCALEPLASHGVSVIGSAMAILDAYTGLLIVVESGSYSAEDLRRLLLDQLAADDRGAEEPFASQVQAWPIGPIDGAEWSTDASHTVHCEAIEAPGILGNVTALLAERNVNIVKARAGIRVDPPHDHANCIVDLAIAIPSTNGDEAHLRTALDQMRTEKGWATTDLRPAPPDPDDLRFARDPSDAIPASDWQSILDRLEPVELDEDPLNELRAIRDS